MAKRPSQAKKIDVREAGTGTRGVTLVFAVAIFVSAALLFSVQPMAAKWVLPALGGSPAVWIAAMLFFQIALLAGYAYAYLLTEKLSRKAQVAVHGSLVLLAIALLPLHISESRSVDQPPVLWLFVTLAVGIGLPLLVLASTAPLLQRWFLSASERSDPYALYAASNLGSFAAVLAYPFVIEPWLALWTPGDRLFPPSLGSPSQNLLWSLGFVGFAAACWTTAAFTYRASGDAKPVSASEPEADARTRWTERALWLALAAIPSSALLGTTLTITTDVAAIPLLWIAPLAIYLLTFVVAFARPGLVSQRNLSIALAVTCLGWVLARRLSIRLDPIWMVPIVIAPMAAAAWLLHDRLSRSRPRPERLAEFYLWIAAGGALGGLFNAVVAPAVLRDVWEYPAALVLAVLLGTPVPSSRKGETTRRALDFALPVAFALGLYMTKDLATTWSFGQRDLFALAIAALPLAFVWRPIRFALALGVLLFVTTVEGRGGGTTLASERTFFGVLRVVRTEGRSFQMRYQDGSDGPLERIDATDLFHGTTRHGRQMVDPRFSALPTSYFHPSGPIGTVFRTFQGTGRFREVGIIGLGVGTLAAYGEKGQTISFYEIDPAVVRIAQDTKWFTYLRDSAATLRILVGDGRLLLEQEPDGRFDLIVGDGFTADAIPVHLLTRESVAMYRKKLRPGGLIALNLSNRHFDLNRVACGIARELGMHGLDWDEPNELTTPQEIEGKKTSHWVVLSDDPAILEKIRPTGAWRDLAEVTPVVWTDTFSSPLAIMR